VEAVWFKSGHHGGGLTGELPVVVCLGLCRRDIADGFEKKGSGSFSFVVSKPGSESVREKLGSETGARVHFPIKAAFIGVDGHLPVFLPALYRCVRLTAFPDGILDR